VICKEDAVPTDFSARDGPRAGHPPEHGQVGLPEREKGAVLADGLAVRPGGDDDEALRYSMNARSCIYGVARNPRQRPAPELLACTNTSPLTVC
jgi:hypothetical protein